MPLTEKELILNIPALIKLIAKLVRFSRGGLSKEEKEELGFDLIHLGTTIVPEAID
jgi:hypothetical protein